MSEVEMLLQKYNQQVVYSKKDESYTYCCSIKHCDNVCNSCYNSCCSCCENAPGGGCWFLPCCSCLPL